MKAADRAGVATRNGRRITLTRLAGVVVAISLGLAAGIAHPSAAQAPPQRSLFLLHVMAPAPRGGYRSVERGTGFFVSADGTALTASHVVYPVRGNPTYRLMAVLGREFYGATLVCASDLPYDPATTMKNVAPSLDVAQIRVTGPEALGVTEMTYKGIPYASAHVGALPAFPALTMAEPHTGETVRVLGFGAAEQSLPYEWSAIGTVSRMMRLMDGTPAFDLAFSDKVALPGHSGSPVLNTSDRVVGLWDWSRHDHPNVGIAISSSALRTPCSPRETRAVEIPALGQLRVLRAALTHAVASGIPTDDPPEFASGDRVYAYVAVRFDRPLTAAQVAARPAIVWRWTAPSGEVLEQTLSSDFLKPGQTQASFWSPRPDFAGKVQQPIGTWSVECLWQDLSVARMTRVMVP